MGKSKIVKFSTSIYTTENILDYVHYDFWGLARNQSMGGARCFITMVDDYSRKVWLYMFKTKDEAILHSRNERVWLRIRREKAKEAKKLGLVWNTALKSSTSFVNLQE